MQNQPSFISFPPLKDWSLSAAVAGVLASTMGYAGPLVILFQVAESANLSSEVLTSGGCLLLAVYYVVGLACAIACPCFLHGMHRVLPCSLP